MAFTNEHYESKERFSLLLLEPGEIYFLDYMAYFYPEDSQADNAHSKRQRGRLKLCSKSILFEPKDCKHPILKFAFRDILTIDRWEVPSIAQNLRLEGSQDDCMFCIESDQVVFMKEENDVKPYTFHRKYAAWHFNLAHLTMDATLPFMNQLLRASTLPLGDQAAMIHAIVLSRQSRVKFDHSWIEDLYESVVMEMQGDRITPLVVNPGWMLLSNMRLYFQPFNNIGPLPVMKIKLSSISRIIKRRFLLRHVGLEIFCEEGGTGHSHLYMAFKDEESRNNMLDKIMEQDEVTLDDQRQENMTLKWQSGVISNYDYLMFLNTMADRSSNDLTQYPVFPWVISNYTSKELDLNDKCNFRDLSKPMGAIGTERLLKLLERYDEMPEPRFLYGSHYSNPGYVLFYLARSAPEYMLCLQNGKFDHPDRIFNSMADTWRNCLTSMSDFKELIPEFYESDGDFLAKNPLIDFGIRQDGKPVAEVTLPPWAESPKDFILKMKAALESDYVSENLHKWIDLIFGYKQVGEEAENSYNVFYHLTYEGAVNVDEVEDLNQRAALETQIMEFGQTPKQLFKQPHPSRRADVKEALKNIESLQKQSDAQLNTDSESINQEKIEKLYESASDLKVVDSTGPLSIGMSVSDNISVTQMKWSFDSSFFYTSSKDGRVRKYSTSPIKLVQSANISSMPVSSFEIIFDGRIIIAGCYDNTICLYDMEYGKILQQIMAHDDAVSCLHASEDLVVSGSWDSVVKVWKFESKTASEVALSSLSPLPKRLLCKLVAIRDFEGENSVSAVCLSKKSMRLAVGDEQGLVSLWDLKNDGHVSSINVHSSEVISIRLSPNEDQMLSAGHNQSIHIFDVKTGVKILFAIIPSPLSCLVWNGKMMLGGTTDGCLIVWDLIESELIKKYSAMKGAVTSICISPCGQLATGFETGQCLVWSSPASQKDPSDSCVM